MKEVIIIYTPKGQPSPSRIQNQPEDNPSQPENEAIENLDNWNEGGEAKRLFRENCMATLAKNFLLFVGKSSEDANLYVQ